VSTYGSSGAAGPGLAEFPHLLAPLPAGVIGTLQLRNRIAMCPMGTNLGESDGTVGDAQAAWFEARAAGGAGLILVGSMAVAYPHGSFDARQVAVSDDSQLPGLRRLVDGVHRNGAAIAAQLVHDGTNSLLDIAQGRPLLVPSRKRPPTPDALSAMVTPAESAQMMAPFSSPSAAYAVKEATDDDLQQVIDQFVDAAVRAQHAGFDGIELHAGHGYLLHAFLSPFTNQRDDDWGGSLTARTELLVETIRAVRSAVGASFPLWARIGMYEAHRDPSDGLEDALLTMQYALDAGIDALHVTAYAEPMVATGITDGHTPHRPAALLGHAAVVRRELGASIIAMGRVTPERADQAIADDEAQVIAMGRALIADPDLPNKLLAGRRHLVRPCAYQYRCIGSIFLNDHVRCAVNPDAGHEAERVALPDIVRDVLVVGGGPAGLEAARRIAERGHRVELWERDDQLGGRLQLAELADPDLEGLREWLIGAAADIGVHVRTGVLVDADAVAAGGFDTVIWAAGASWSPDGGGLDLDGAAPWLDGTDEGLVGQHVLIRGGGKAAVSIAKHAAIRGHDVALVAPGPVLASELGLPGRFRLVHDTDAAGVRLHPDTTDEPPELAGGADTVLRIGPGEPRPLPDLPADIDIYVIGDANDTVGLAAAFEAAKVVAEIL
jgi:2,4-dienoyl-CoA reductase-like NADH-dependent reductase (Old Yellow Enzyme family)